ncbi:MAG: DUF4375 domain-containing protein, partial [Candidatus Sumerlaeia bacterium]|nr:DUF4375 domain-containing protein [Candidatus Sumerlaeia bacterium]
KIFKEKLINILERILQDGNNFLFEGKDYYNLRFKEEFIELSRLYAFDKNGNYNNACLDQLSKNKVYYINRWIPHHLNKLTVQAQNDEGVLNYFERNALDNLISLFAITNPEEAKDFAHKLVDIQDKEIRKIGYKVLIIVEGLEDWDKTFEFNEVLDSPNEDLKIERAYALSLIADADTCNGGLFQYLYNSYSDNHKDNINAFRMMGMEEKASIFERLDNLFKPNGVPTSREARQMIMSDKYSGIESSISKLESQYFQSTEDHKVHTLMIVLNNKDYFKDRISQHKELEK